MVLNSQRRPFDTFFFGEIDTNIYAYAVMLAHPSEYAHVQLISISTFERETIICQWTHCLPHIKIFIALKI